MENRKASVIFILEGEVTNAINMFRNVRELNYDNIEYVFVYNEHFDYESFRKKVYEDTDLDYAADATFIKSGVGIQMLKDGIETATGDFMFLKTCLPVIWYPNHIKAHLAKHDKLRFRNSCILSQIEDKAKQIQFHHPLSTIGYRLGHKVPVEQINFDEISLSKDVRPEYDKYVTDIQGNSVIDVHKFVAWLFGNARINFADEISVVRFVDQPQQEQEPVLTTPDWQLCNTVQSINDEDWSIIHKMPTLFGNTQLDGAWNNKVRGFLKTHWEDIKKRKVPRFIFKRTIGMGDVIETEPVLRWFKSQCPQAEIWYVTSDSRGCSDIVKTFGTKIDQILPSSGETGLFQDLLGSHNLPELLTLNGHDKNLEFDLRIDLDLAYESRPETRFVDAYLQMTGLDVQDGFDRTPELLNAGLAQQDLVSVCLNGSGWGGKELEPEAVKKVLMSIKEKGYRLAHVSGMIERYQDLIPLFDEINSADNFQMMYDLVSSSAYYVGADNGPMHVAAGLKKPILVWNGAATSKITTAYENIQVIQNAKLECLGCRHKNFYSKVQVRPNEYQISFVVACPVIPVFSCMRSDGFDDKTLQEAVSIAISAHI